MLPPVALDIIRAQPQLGDNPFVFAGRGDGAGERLQQAEAAVRCPAVRRRALGAARSAKDRAQPDEPGRGVERARRARPGPRHCGVEGVYDRHAYRDEKAEALRKLAALIDGIVHPRDERRADGEASQAPMTSQLPTTLIEAEAVAFARAEIDWYRDNPIPMFGIDVRFLDRDDARRFARHTVKTHALHHPTNMMMICDYARAGWDLADEALREAIIEFLDRGELLPTYLASYNMEVARGGFRRASGPKKADNFFRDIALMAVVENVGKKFGFKPTRNLASKRPSACSIVAQAVGLSEPAIVAIWQRLGRWLQPTPPL